MLTKENQIKSIIKGFNECKTFEEQIKYLGLNHHILELHLDNDGEYISFVDEELCELEDEMYDCNPFNNLHSINYIGNTDGAFKLLEILGVNVRYV